MLYLVSYFHLSSESFKTYIVSMDKCYLLAVSLSFRLVRNLSSFLEGFPTRYSHTLRLNIVSK